jgi:dihydrofolate reductase
MRINLIFAQADNGIIGINNQLPWHLPQDLAHFKAHTTGCPVIMGRKTWDSLPPQFRPLPGRLNIVVSRQADLQAAGAHVCSSLEAAVQLCAQHDPQPAEVWIIGGAQLYALAMPLASRAVVTYIHADFEGDALAPTFDAQWSETARESHTTTSSDASAGLGYSFVTLERSTHA